MLRRTAIVLVTAAAFIAAVLPARADIDCGAAIPVTMIDTMSTANSWPGERFRFKTLAPVKHGDVEIPIGTVGWGVVRYVHHAETRNRGGLIVLEPRILTFGSDDINVMADPRESAQYAPAYTVAEQGFDMLPIGLIRTAFDAARYGREVTLGPGFNFHIIIVDDIAEKEPCVPASPSPAPSEQRRQSSESPSPSPSP